MAREVVIEQGTSAYSISNLYDNYSYINTQFSATDSVELFMKFSTPFPFLNEQSEILNSQMENQGVEMWSGYNRYTFPSSDGKSLAIRWVHGDPWIEIVIPLVVAIIVVAVIVIILWQLKKVYPNAPIFVNFANISSKILVAGLIGFALYLTIPRIIGSSTKPP